jgi:penicillin-binding protein 2
MILKHKVLLLLLLLATVWGYGCNESPPLAQPLPEAPATAAAPPTAVLVATEIAAPTATPAPAVPIEAIALAYFRAWEGGDYLRMYSVLTPESRAAIDSRSFVTLYEESMKTATVQQIQSRLLKLDQEDDRAELTVRVTWQTAVAGAITRDHQVTMINNQGRWGVVWHHGLILPELQAGQRLHREPQPATRAAIYDVNGHTLAYQGTVVRLGVVPGNIADENSLLAALSPILNQTAEEIKAIYAPALPDWYWPIGDVSGDLFQAHLARLQPHIGAGLITSERPARLYPAGAVTAHIVGYTGFIPAEQLARYQAEGYQGDEQVGLTGLEAWGESYLSGVGGLLTLVGPQGERLAVIEGSNEGGARAIYSTIDYNLQRAVAEALAAAVTSHPDSEAGAVVVLDVATGKVRAMASFPTYDPVVFDHLRLNAATDLGTVLRDPGRPLFNRVTQGEYPPGSTFKIVTMAAALNSDLYTLTTEYTSTGAWNRLGDSFVKYDWLEGGHGTLTLGQALSVSCNSCFYDAGYNLNGADPYLLPQVARRFGFGAPSGIDGLPEAAGLAPDPAYKVTTHGLEWVAGDAVNMAIGQGYVLATPLQLARMVAAIANGGTLFRPTLIDRIGNGDGAEELWPVEAVAELPLSAEHLAALRQALVDVTASELGTAVEQFQRFTVPVAGKTGTSETAGLPHAFFAGYAPAAPYTRSDGTVVTEPEIAIVVLMEHAGQGSEAAAPVFRRIVELYYNIRPLTTYPWQR